MPASPAWLASLLDQAQQFVASFFVRPEGADVTQWDEAQAQEWIADWGNYTLNSLFFLRSELLNSFGQFFAQSIQDTSNQNPDESNESGLSETAEAE